jgi:hypothetical protein
MPAPRVETVLGPAKREIGKALRAYNTAEVGNGDYHPFAVTIRDKGKIVAGLVAEMYWGWMSVNLMWVSERRRGKGFGRSLLERLKRSRESAACATCISIVSRFRRRISIRSLAIGSSGGWKDSRPVMTGFG